MFYVWLISFGLFAIISTTIFVDWIFRTNKLAAFGTVARIITGGIALVSFLVFLVSTIIVAHPEYGLKDEHVTITPIAEVYQCDPTTAETIFYYVSKEGDSTLYEIKVNKVSTGDSNYVITKESSNGTVINELVLIDKESIPLLPNFNN